MVQSFRFETMQITSPKSGPVPTRAGRSPRPFLPALAALLVLSLWWALSVGGGFQGWDDLHYLKGAEKWAFDGPNVPTSHWEARLPYVLLISAALRVFETTAALFVVNSVLFLIVLFCCWSIARLCFDERSAILSVFVAATTPLIFRYPATFYPEPLETALAAGAIGLTLASAWKVRSPRNEAFVLFGAGLLGGAGMVLRATSVVVPLGLTAFLIYQAWPHPLRAVRRIALLAAGHAMPVMAEAAFYAVMTGNPLHRFEIDTGAIVASKSQVGADFTGNSALFNWRLASLWGSWAPSVLGVHWTISPVVNLFTTPGSMLTPWIGAVALVQGARSEGRGRALALLTCVIWSAQYILSTFVLALSPSPRYYAISLFLLSVLAGRLLASIVSRLLLFALLTLQLALAIAAGLMQISPATVINALKAEALTRDRVYVSERTAEAAYVAMREDPGLSEKVRVGPAPVGEVALIGWDGWPRDTLNQICDGGGSRWDVLSTRTHPSLPWRILHTLGLSHVLPGKVARYLRRDAETAVVARRAC